MTSRLGLIATSAVLVSFAASAIPNGTMARVRLLPVCPDAAKILRGTTPNYARVGQGMPVKVAVGRPQRITEPAVTVSGRDYGVSQPIILAGALTRLILRVPDKAETLALTIRWTQDAGTQEACTGSEVHMIPLVGAHASVGDPTQPRLAGRFAVVEHPYNLRGKTTTYSWKMTPLCDYFACTTALESSGGLHISLKPGLNAKYHGVTKSSLANDDCTVVDTRISTITGQVISRSTKIIHHAWRETDNVDLKNLKVNSAGTVPQFGGSLTQHFKPTAQALSQHCTKSFRFVYTLSGRQR
jgi:hypothetical protein